MHRSPRARPDTPQREYGNLLDTAMGLHGEYQTILGQAFDLDRGGDSVRAHAVRREVRGIERRMREALRQRVHVLRRTDQLQTLDDVLPSEQVAWADAAAATVQRMLTKRSHPAPALTPASDVNVTDVFRRARRQLASSMGYHVESDDDEWLIVERNAVVLEMRHRALRDDRGITGHDRIAELIVSVRDGEVPRIVCELGDPNERCLPCTDARVQAEIDRAIAIFA